MDNQVVLDSCQYDINDNGNCVLKGWFYLGGEKPEFQVRFGHEALPFELRFVPRPDVIAAFPGVTFPDENTGFELVLKNLTELFERQESLRIRVCGKEEKFPLLQKTAEELQTEYRQDTVKYFIEKTERHMENVYLQGWCIHSLGELTMTLENEKGEALEGAKWTSLRRADLAELFQKDLSACEGFGVEIPRKNIHGKELVLFFDNGLARKKEILDMKKFDQENSRRGKVRKLFQKENRKETLKILKENGVSGLREYIQEESLGPEEYYNYYARRMAPGKRVLARQAMENFTETPLFSIVVPLYRTPLPYLKELIDSVVAQSYGNWQLCLADGSDNHQIQEFMKKNYSRDRRICYKLLEENTGISGNTNAALSMAVGDFIVFADHDDTLTPDALYENVKVLEANPEADFIYSDEDLTDEFGEVYDPHFKPDFNLDYLRSINYICHLVVVKRSLYEQVGKLNPEYDGAQDYDFVLRCVEKAKDIHHIPKVLYHWRSHSGSTAGNGDNKQYAIDAGRKALEAHYERLGMETEVTYTGLTIVYDTKYKVKGDPMVSVLIPNKDHVDDLDQCIRSIEEKTTWNNYEILVIENNSEDPETFAYYEKAKEQWKNLRIVHYEGGFNYSAINNLGASEAKGEYYILLNNDTEVITGDWMERMLGYCQRQDVGIVGSKLLYPDDTIQHAGVVIGIGGVAGHIEVGREKTFTGYMRRLSAAQDISAVTAACLMIKKTVFDEIGGLSEELAVAFNDVDLCLRARELGYLVVYDPQVQLYHYESKSRGYETTPEKIKRFQKEIDIFQKRHKDILEKGDPYYNPNLSLTRGDCAVIRLSETMKGKNS